MVSALIFTPQYLSLSHVPLRFQVWLFLLITCKTTSWITLYVNPPIIRSPSTGKQFIQGKVCLCVHLLPTFTFLLSILSIRKCFEEGIFMVPLGDKFFKLALQIISRSVCLFFRLLLITQFSWSLIVVLLQT